MHLLSIRWQQSIKALECKTMQAAGGVVGGGRRPCLWTCHREKQKASKVSGCGSEAIVGAAVLSILQERRVETLIKRRPNIGALPQMVLPSYLEENVIVMRFLNTLINLKGSGYQHRLIS